jgi:UMF1 family MFS transporter
VLYDLANTVYAATLTFVFTPFARERLGGLGGYGVVSFASMVLAALLVPFLGALIDQNVRTHRYLAAATVACVTAIAGFGLELGSGWLLACFFVANLTYNLALLFYNTLLPSVAAPGDEGRIGGIGVGIGYFGTIAVLLVLLPLPLTQAQRFPAAALLFLLAALPCLALVRDRRPGHPGTTRTALRSAARDLLATLRQLPQRPALAWFLLGNFCLVDVLNTAVLYFADFTTQVFAASAARGDLPLFGWQLGGDPELRTLLQVMGVSLNLLALVAGLAVGRWTDRAPLAVMRSGGVALGFALLGGAWFGGRSPLGYLLTLVALGAYGLSAIWTAGRKVIVLLAPPAQLGAYFGLYGITLKLSVLGSVGYGLISDRHGAVPAMLVQGVPLLLGLGCLAMVRLPVATPPHACHE